MSITLALQQRVPNSAVTRAKRWVYAGDDPNFDVPGLERVATADALMDAAQELRQQYLDAIGDLSELNSSSEWWASHLAAKHPYPSLFARICGVAAVVALATDDTLVVCSTPAQVQTLHSLLQAARPAGIGLARLRRASPGVALETAWPLIRAFGAHAPDVVRRAAASAGARPRFALDRTPGHRLATLKALGAPRLGPLEGQRTALLVTWIDQRCFGPRGEYRDPHLGPLGSMLSDHGWTVARLLKPLLHAPFAECARAMVASGERAAFADCYLTEADWRECERRVRRARVHVPDEIAVGAVPVAALAREYYREHRRAQAEALSHELLADKLAAAGVHPEVVIFPWEGHAWEHVLTAGVQRSMPGTKTIGYDNLNFSRFALSLYPAQREIGVRPLPDRVVTNGPTFARSLTASSFPHERIRVGCALRHQHLADRPDARGERGALILAACSIDEAQSIELLRKAHEAFGNDMVAKLHPASDARAIRAALPDSVRYSDKTLSDLLPGARLMLYTYSVVPYEALAAGVPPVFVRSESRLDLDQLDPTPDVRWVARTTEELRTVAKDIDAMIDRSAWSRRASDVVDAALAPVSPACIDAFVA